MIVLYVDRVPNGWTMELVMKDALYIQAKLANARFNRDSRYELPDCWITLNKNWRVELS